MNEKRMNANDRVWLVIDEIQNLTVLNSDILNKEFIKLLGYIASNGRQYRISSLFSTQTAKHNTIPTEIRDNMQVRIAGRCKRESQSESVLGDGHTEAYELSQTGSFIYLDDSRNFLLYSYDLTDQDIPFVIDKICYKFQPNKLINFDEISYDIPEEILEIFEEYFVPEENKMKSLGWKRYANGFFKVK